MFRAIQIQLACAACIAEEKAHECQHMAHLIPRWQDSEKHRKLKTIMSDRAVTLCRCCFLCVSSLACKKFTRSISHNRT